MTPLQRNILLASCVVSILGWVGFWRLEGSIQDSGFYGMLLMTLWITPLILYLTFRPDRPVKLSEGPLGSWWLLLGLTAFAFFVQESLNGNQILPDRFSDIDPSIMLGLLPAVFTAWKLFRKKDREL